MVLCKTNGGNISKTAKELNISKSLIWKWWNGPEKVLAESEIKEIAVLQETAIDQFKADHPEFIRDVYYAKSLCVNRMLQLIPKEKRLEVLAQTLKALGEVTGEVKDERVQNIYTSITQTLIQNGYGKKNSTDQGD